MSSCTKRNASTDENLLDFNVDCQLLIFECLELPDLISLTETNKNLFPLVEYVLRRRFAKKSITITGLYPNGERIRTEFYVRETEANIRIQHIVIASKVLKYFGYLIQNLRIEHCFLPKDELISLYKLVNLHCSETLTQIHLNNELDDVFAEFSTPFKRVENVSLSGEFQRLYNSQFSFNELFPAMRRLYLGNSNIFDMNWVDQKLPNIEHVAVNIWNWMNYSIPGCFNETIVGRLFKANPQIRSLDLDYVSPNLLKLVSDELQNLETLKLAHYDMSLDDGRKSVHFEHLKSFTMELGTHSMPQRITFGNLEVFKTDATPEDCYRWVEFIEIDKNVKKLQVNAFLTNDEILRLATVTSNLEEILMMCEIDIENESVVKLIKNFKQLKKLDLQMRDTNSTDAIMNILRHTFEADWFISNDIENNVILKKKYL